MGKFTTKISMVCIFQRIHFTDMSTASVNLVIFFSKRCELGSGMWGYILKFNFLPFKLKSDFEIWFNTYCYNSFPKKICIFRSVSFFNKKKRDLTIWSSRAWSSAAIIGDDKHYKKMPKGFGYKSPKTGYRLHSKTNLSKAEQG